MPCIANVLHSVMASFVLLLMGTYYNKVQMDIAQLTVHRYFSVTQRKY